MYDRANIRTVADATVSDFMLNCIKFMIKNTRKQFFLSRVRKMFGFRTVVTLSSESTAGTNHPEVSVKLCGLRHQRCYHDSNYFIGLPNILYGANMKEFKAFGNSSF